MTQSIRRRAIGTVATGALAIGVFAATAATAQPNADGHVLNAEHPDAVSGSYLVTMQDGHTAPSMSRYNAQVTEKWDLVNGFAVDMSQSEAERLAAHPHVDTVEANIEVELDEPFSSQASQDNPSSWGIDRIDQRNLPLDDSYEYNRTGNGVDAYIVDTGVNISHNDFTGRMKPGFDAVDGGDGSDCHGHGTHVAGTVAGSEFGVAKEANVVPVRVLDCEGSGTSADILSGLDWVADNANGPSVANMSLGGFMNSTLDDAVQGLIDSGVTVAVAAGNTSWLPACWQSPARVADAITVAASDNADAAASFTSSGSCVDLFAPGVDITSAWIDGDDSTYVASGTSMASPHVAGGAALYLETNPGASPSQVHGAITSSATSGAVSNPGSGTPNLLLYTMDW